MVDLTELSDIQQDGVFLDADGMPVRTYDDVIMLSGTKPDGDDSSQETIPAGTLATVLFFGPQSGWAQLEHYLHAEGPVDITYAKTSDLRLHMRNEVKYPRYGLSAEQIADAWDLAHQAVNGTGPTDPKLVERSRKLFAEHRAENEKKSLFKALLLWAEKNNSLPRSSAHA